MEGFYNQRYENNYRASLPNYEIARWKALHHFISTRKIEVKNMLDYGAGSGLFIPLWQELFPDADLFFSDISNIAIEKLQKNHPLFQDNCFLINNNKINTDKKFDLIISVEVMEHVDSVQEYMDNIFKLLNPDGIFIWTTPCANSFSIEWVYNKLFNKIQNTTEGYRRWEWEDIGHLRRLKSTEVEQILLTTGFTNIDFRFRAHFFSFAVLSLKKTNFIQKLITHRIGRKLKLNDLLDSMISLDYTLFKYFPNGASMIGFAQKK